MLTDEETVRRVLCSLLKNEGFEVIEAEDGRAGVELAKKEDPDVILMDLTMPVMNGLKACQLLKEDKKTKNIPVLVITTAAGESKMEAIDAGIDDFVDKPFDSEEISIRIKSMLKIKKLTNELERLYVYVEDINKQRKDKLQENKP
ncbi:MAG: response regulator [Candidatus Omnitrophota bacterium]